MKPDKLREMTKEELNHRIHELTEELFNLRFQLQARYTTNPVRVRVIRREIARIKTILREHELGIRKLVGSDE